MNAIKALFRFNGGVKPGYNKAASTGLPIAPLPLPPQLVLPLHQHVGGTPRPLVKAGDRVLKGQRIGAADGDVSAAVHASTSGRIIAIEDRVMPHTSGLSAPCIVLEPDGFEEWGARNPFDHHAASPGRIREYLRDAGIVGLGGAVFPSHLKLKPGQRDLETLVINGAECEPFITCDDMLMRERADQIVQGTLIMQELLGARRVLIGIEDNKPEALDAMKNAVDRHGNATVGVVAVPTIYPAGGAKQLIRVLTGTEVPHGERSTDYGVQCFNVGTAYAIYEAIVLGQPLVSRIVTVAGNVDRARNYEVPIGTPMAHAIAASMPRSDTDRIIMGGPMMGFGMPNPDVPVVKATNCILVGSPSLFPPPPPEMPCIRCGECALACPADLQPLDLYWFSRAKLFGKAQEYHLFDCIECGCCAYVCPSHIPLVDYYRFAKSEIWARENEKQKADVARERFEFRQLRDEREKSERAAKLAAKTAAGRQRAAAALAIVNEAPVASAPATTPEQDAKKALIAAALERVRQHQDGPPPANTEELTDAQQEEIREIEARRAQIREMAKPSLPEDA